MRLSEIAGLCKSCDSPAYFRVFKKGKGMTPIEYKKLDGSVRVSQNFNKSP